MAHTAEEQIGLERLRELAMRSQKTGVDVFTPFLTPPEAALAQQAAKAADVPVALCGGYPQAERVMARFGDEEGEFPFSVVQITWPHSAAPSHRDILGSVMGLGLKRNRLGDIVVTDELAYLFAENAAAELVLTTLTQANKSPVHVLRLEALPSVEPLKGREINDTVLSLRLDAVLSSGFQIARAKAVELIRGGAVKLRYMPTLRPDARVDRGDVISVRGMGRVCLEDVGTLTRKGRLPITLHRFG